MIKIFMFLVAAFALPPIIKLKSGSKEISIHSSAVQDLHYFSAYVDFVKHQKDSLLNEFEIFDECFPVMHHLIGLLAEFKHGKKLQSQFNDYSRLNYCASFYGASNEFLEALQMAQSKNYIRLYVKKYSDGSWRTTVGSPNIYEYSWREAEAEAFNRGYEKLDYGDNYMIFKKLRE